MASNWDDEGFEPNLKKPISDVKQSWDEDDELHSPTTTTSLKKVGFKVIDNNYYYTDNNDSNDDGTLSYKCLVMENQLLLYDFNLFIVFHCFSVFRLIVFLLLLVGTCRYFFGYFPVYQRQVGYLS
jgi:hypothetical protein